jgi:hypothetical protein
MKTIILVLSLCVTASATILPNTLFSGDATGWNNFQPGASGTANSPNIAISDAQAGLVLPDGITAVSFSVTANATDGTTVEYVDQWQTFGTTSLILDWWASGPTTIWFDGGVGGILVDATGTGEQSGTVNLTETDGYHYFAAFVTASDGKDSFAYNLSDPPALPEPSNVPEPGTVATLAIGLGVLFVRCNKLFVRMESRIH